MMEGQHHSTDMASYTSESEFMPLNDEELDSKSGSDNQETKSGDDEQANANQRPKRKRYNRHTHNQIQALETFFKGCPHPDDNQRMELARQLGLKPMQVKFWFQNKRTQTKNHFEHNENALLRAENEKYKAENVYLREALNNAAICPTCRGPTNNLGELSYAEHLLKLENNRLSEEVGRISAIAANFVGKPVSSFNVDSPLITPHSLDLGVQPYSTQHNVIGDAYGSGGERMISGPTEVEKPFIIEVAVAAMEELIQMANMGEPLWLPSIDGGTNFLNENEYARIFPRGIGPKPEGFKTEASKETAVVILNHNNLVEIFMDVDHWSSMFSNIVSSAVTLDVLSTGAAGNFNGALQVIFAEFQVPSPQIPTRECYFVRYCKQSVDGIWAIVDVSLDHLRGNPTARCRRRPSGCLIQEMPNGYSKVTWIEHIDADDSAIHDIYKPLVNYGLAFGAKRWLATLDRQCERLASAMASIIPNNDINHMVISTQEAKKSTLRLAERMVISFCSGVSATAAHQWTTLSGSGLDSDVRIMTRKSIDDPGKPSGIVLSVATSFWLPICPNRVFDFLRDENTRSQWDILSNGGIVQEMAHIANGRENGNCVSLLRVINENSSESNMLILQESSTDPTGSFVVYAPVDVPSMNIVLGGGEPDYVALLPSGFAILPDGPPGNNGVGVGNGAGSGGSLLTVAFQILVDSVPTAKLSLGSVATVNKLIDCTVDRIKASLLSEAHDF